MTLALLPSPDERLTPLERLEALSDAGSLQLIRTQVRSRVMQGAPAGDGVLAGQARIEGRQVCCYAQDASFLGGSLGAAHAETLVNMLRLARRGRLPVVGFVESAGARMQEGLAALSGYGALFREHVALSGEVPQISIVCGAAAGGSAYGPALNDFVIMGGGASMFLTGPAVVAEVTGEQVDMQALGGARVHDRNGVCHLNADGEADAARLARELLGYLPQRAGTSAPRASRFTAPAGSPDRVVPGQGRRVYDMRHVAAGLVDEGSLLELSPRWARNVVTAMARLEGRSIGIVANQPRHLGGVLDAAGSEKAAWFVRACDRFGLPLLVLVDTPGFLPGTRQERDGVIRHGAGLLRAFAQARVPSVTLVLRKAFGGAFIAMNSKTLGADYVFAWPGAELGVMGAPQAVGIIRRREIAGAEDPARHRSRLAAAYAAEHLGVERAGADGFVDEVISPETTRARIAFSFDALAGEETAATAAACA